MFGLGFMVYVLGVWGSRVMYRVGLGLGCMDRFAVL